MIVIRKKTIFNCLILFSICFISYSLIKNNNKEQQVVALPVSNKVIVIDAGHRWRRWRSGIRKWNIRSKYKFTDCTKTAKFIRTKWSNSNINKVNR